MTTYAVVPTRGTYAQGAIVRPVSRHRTLEAATRRAAKATKEYRAAMAPHGGSTGGYRVVEGAGPWLGLDLDREPSAK